MFTCLTLTKTMDDGGCPPGGSSRPLRATAQWEATTSCSSTGQGCHGEIHQVVPVEVSVVTAAVAA